LGYRFLDGEAGSGALVYISDNELGDGVEYEGRADWRASLVKFATGAKVLVHDTMYTREEYEHHRGWGHSTYDDAVKLALEAGVETLVLYHHKPERSDDEVDACVERCRALVAEQGGALTVIAAAEGLTLTV
jgi:ribonuclease BN (tRNA processing enzyme)